jgi:integrase
VLFSIYLATERDLDRETCTKYRAFLKGLFRFAKLQGEPVHATVDRFIIPIKKRDCSPKYIPQEKQVALLEDVFAHDYQLFVACEIMYCSGLRPKELLNLKVGDIDFVGGTIRVLKLVAKTRKCRYADLTDELADYLRHYGVTTAEPEKFLFCRGGCGDKHWSINMLADRFRHYRQAHGISDEVKYYSWKHTGATDLINSKLATLVQLKNHLGHDRLT